MDVDLIKALDTRATEAPRGEGREGEGDFPEVFASALESNGSEESPERGSEGEAQAEAEERSESQARSEGDDAQEDQTKPADAEAEEAASAGAETEEQDAKAEAVAESGAVGGEAYVLADRVLAQPAEVPVERSGLEDLPEESTNRRAEAVAAVEQVGAEEALDEEQAREVAAQLEAAGLGAADGDEASATSDAAVEGAVASGAPQATAGVAEASAPIDANATGTAEAEREIEVAASERSEARSESEEQPASREEAPRTNEESLFERAAEGSQNAAVDPNLRQAVSNAEEAQRAPQVAAIDGAPAVASPVAGQVTETTTTATPGSPQPVAASEAISIQTEWLATRGGGTARMVLHPAELGEIAIRVTLRNGAVDVVMVAQEAAAQGVAEEQSERLAQAFANRDLRLENFEVRRGGAEELPDGAMGQFAESETERDGRPGEEESGGKRGQAGGVESEGEAPVAVPRILTRAPETGVDLRI